MKGPASRLDNGVEVLTRTVPEAPVAAVYLWIDAGAADESPERAGTAHFLEHMLFKGTGQRVVGAAAAEIEGLGGDLNAYTSHDETVLHATVEARHWRQALDVIGDMARNSDIDAAELDRERAVILEEIRSYEDDPEAVASDHLAARVFRGHPYGRPVLGGTRTVRRLQRKDLHRFWQACWCGRRATLSVAGPVDPAEVQAAARDTLGGWATGSAREPIAAASAPPGPTARVIRRDFDTTAVELAWQAPPLGHPDLPALEVLAAVLGQGAASLLSLRLQIDEGLAGSVWCDLSARLGGGTLGVGFLPMEDEAAHTTEMALDTVGRVARGALPGAVVARARDALLAEFLFGEETVDGVAHDQAWYAARTGSPAGREAYRAALAKVTATDVLRVGRTWLRPEACHAVAVDRKLTNRTLLRAVRAGLGRFGRPNGRTRSRGAVTCTLHNGARICVLPDEAPVAGVRILAPGGALAVTPGRAGLPAAWSAMITTGAGPWDAGGFAEASDRVAAVIAGFAGYNTVGLQASFPATWLEDGVELLGRTVIEPRFDPHEWDRVGDELLEDVRTIADRSGEVAMRALWAELWRGHPWRLPLGGTEASIARITATSLLTWHEAQFDPAGIVAGIAGGVDPDAAIAHLAQWLDRLPSGEPLSPRPQPAPPRARTRRLHAGSEQATLVVGFRGPHLGDPDRYAIEVAGAILGSQGGRLFLELRERRGLAYAVWAQSRAGVDGGVFFAGLSTDPRRAEEARISLSGELERFAEQGPTDEEVQRCRRMMIGQRAMGLQRAVGRAADLAIATFYGLDPGLDGYRAALETVDAAAIRAAMKRYLGAGLVEVTVSPRPR